MFNIKFFSSLLILIALLLSCKNDNSNKSKLDDTIIPEINYEFKISLVLVITKDDNLQLYYTDETSNGFSEDKSIWIEVKGSDSPQVVTFVLPKDVFPSLFRLDFGLNEEQEDIIFKSFKMEYLGKSFNSEGKNLENYFRPIHETKIDFNTGIINAKNENGTRVEPVLYPHEVPLGDEISKLK